MTLPSGVRSRAGARGLAREPAGSPCPRPSETPRTPYRRRPPAARPLRRPLHPPRGARLRRQRPLGAPSPPAGFRRRRFRRGRGGGAQARGAAPRCPGAGRLRSRWRAEAPRAAGGRWKRLAGAGREVRDGDPEVRPGRAGLRERASEQRAGAAAPVPAPSVPPGPAAPSEGAVQAGLIRALRRWPEPQPRVPTARGCSLLLKALRTPLPERRPSGRSGGPGDQVTMADWGCKQQLTLFGFPREGHGHAKAELRKGCYGEDPCDGQALACGRCTESTAFMSQERG